MTDPYRLLGVKPFINCCGTRSVYGGSLILPQVRAAMEAASRQFVNIDELMERARLRIATLTGAEDGLVTAGSAAAIAIATAAALAGNDPVRMLRLPHELPRRSQVMMLKGHRFPYDQAIRMTRAEIVEIESVADLAAIDTSKIAMIAFLASRNSTATVSLEQLVEFGHRHRIPLLVDAASLPIRRPDAWLARGADLVVYSGGKLLRGPQTSGLLLGRKHLIDAAWANSPPHRAFGRPMKVGKEEIVGLVAALEAWFIRDEAAERNLWQSSFEAIAAAIASVPGATLQQIAPDEGEDAPLLQLTWAGALHGLELRRRLLDGQPRIMLDDVSAGPGKIRLEMVNLQAGEGEIVGTAIATALLKPVIECDEAQLPNDLSGSWEFEVQFATHSRTHRVSLVSSTAGITGYQDSEAFSGPVKGEVRGATIHLVFEAEYEATIIVYRFAGMLADGKLAGEVMLGSCTPHSRGEVNCRQYGSAKWRGQRAEAMTMSDDIGL